MAKKKGDYPIPFSKRTGDMLAWVHPSLPGPDVEMRDNHTFGDTLRYVDYERGQSAARLVFKSMTNGVKYLMFLADFHDMMMRAGFNKFSLTTDNVCTCTSVNATWTFRKRGENYGIRLADEQ